MKVVNLRQLRETVRGNGRLLGFDVGARHVGVAVSDPACRIASPLSVLYRSQATILSNVDKLDDIVRRFSVDGLVVGYPFELGGNRTSQERMVKSFVSELHHSGRFQNISYIYWDERLTSAAVSRTFRDLQLKDPQRKQFVDKMAALGILQDCLDHLWRDDEV